MVIPYFKSDSVQLFHDDCINVLNSLPENSVDMIFCRSTFIFLSNGGISCRAGKMVSVNKANWDKSQGLEKDFEFTQNWIKACRRVLKDNGSFYFWHNNMPTISKLMNIIESDTNFIFRQMIVWNKRFEGSKKKDFLMDL